MRRKIKSHLQSRYSADISIHFKIIYNFLSVQLGCFISLIKCLPAFQVDFNIGPKLTFIEVPSANPNAV